MCSSAVQIRITRVAFLSTGTYFESGEVLKASLISRVKWMKAILFGISWQQSLIAFFAFIVSNRIHTKVDFVCLFILIIYLFLVPNTND